MNDETTTTTAAHATPAGEAPPTMKQRSVLNDLIVDCRDDGQTFRDAAATSQGRYHDELLALSRQRSSFVKALSTFVRRTGTAPAQRGSALGWVRRTLFQARETILGTSHMGDSLGACANQEARTMGSYVDALKSDGWSTEIEPILRSQLHEIQETHARVVSLRAHL